MKKKTSTYVKPLTDQIEERKQSVLAKQSALKKESQELYNLQKRHAMETLTEVTLSTEELAAFIAGLDGFTHKADASRGILAAAQTAKLDVLALQQKLLRMNLL